MLKILSRNQNAQNVILNQLFDVRNLNICVNGELIIGNLKEVEVIETFLGLLKQNLVSEVTFEYEEEANATDKNVPNVESTNVSSTEEKETIKPLREIMYEFFKENEGKVFSIKEVADITGLKYQTVAGSIRRIYMESNFLIKTDDKKYGYKIPQENTESKLEAEQIQEESEIPTKEEEEPDQEEATGSATLSVENQLKVMKELFSQEKNLDVLKYIFPIKRNFLVNLAQKKFVGEAQEILTQIIRKLSELEIITFDEVYKDGRYYISPKWSLWAFLFFKGKPQTKETIRYEISMRDEELCNTIEQAVSENIVIKTQEKGESAIYSVR